MVIIKKYGNRRLYDTGESRYITQDELAAAIKRGIDVRVVDAKTNEDLTQATLAQLVIENAHAARALPVGLLTQLIRLDDEVQVVAEHVVVHHAEVAAVTARRDRRAHYPRHRLAPKRRQPADHLERHMQRHRRREPHARPMRARARPPLTPRARTPAAVATRTAGIIQR